MGKIFIWCLRMYAISDIILSLVSSIGWYSFWQLSKCALYIQRYEILRQSYDALVEDSCSKIKNFNTDSEKLFIKQRQMSEICGIEPNGENIYQSLVKFNDIILMVLTPSTFLCCLAMFGFFLGGIMILFLTIMKRVIQSYGIVLLIGQFISIGFLLCGSLLTTHTKLCPIEFMYNIRLILIGTIFVVLILYKVYEIVMIIHYIRAQSRISQENNNINGINTTHHNVAFGNG